MLAAPSVCRDNPLCWREASLSDEYGYENTYEDPEQVNDPRRLLDECWRVETRTRNAAYGERYVAFLDLIGRLTGLSTTTWDTFAALYNRELRRHRPPHGEVHDWFSLVKARRG